MSAEDLLDDGSIMVETRRIPTTPFDTHNQRWAHYRLHQTLGSLHVTGRSPLQSKIYTAKSIAFQSKLTIKLQE